MSRAYSADVDLPQLQHQFASDLAQTERLDVAVAHCLALLDSLFGPSACQIVWDVEGQPQLLGGSADAAPMVPGAEVRAWLATGELSLNSAAEQQVACFAPLRARGALLGWIYLATAHWTSESASLLTMIAAQVGPSLALLEAGRRQEERVAQLRTLAEISRLISGELDLTTLLEAIYRAACRVVDVSNFYIALYDDATEMLDLAYIVRDKVLLTPDFRWRASEGMAGVIIALREPLCTDDYLTECRRHGISPRPIADLPIARAWLGVPLFANDLLVGVMVISSLREGYAYTGDQVELMATIGAQAAIAIENARLYQRSERQARQLETLNNIGRTLTSSLDPERVPPLIMEHVCELLDVEEGSLLLTDSDTGDLVFAYTNGPVGSQLLGQRLPSGVGLAGYVVSSGQSVVVNDAQGDHRFYALTDQTTGFTTRNLMAVPLRGVGGIQGVIEVMNRRGSRLFSDEDRRLLEAVADQAVIALENASRFAQIDQALARRAQELARTNDLLQHSLQSLIALNALGMAINTSLRDPEEIYGMTARGVVEMTGALGAAVLLHDRDDFVPAIQIGLTPPVAPLGAIAQQVIQTGRPEVMQYDYNQVKSLLAVPLRATQRTLGALCVYYADTFPEAPDQETVVLFATQAAGAVESLGLFTAIRGARDQMASILASTREGIMLIGPDRRVALANVALHRLCDVGPNATRSVDIMRFVAEWEQVAAYAADDWTALREGLDAVTSGRERFASNQLNATDATTRSVEWAALTAHGSGDSNGGALLVLRDISEAKDAERLRQDLTNMIVHDLRSPLSSVMASIDLLVRGVSGDLNDSQRGVLQIAYSSSVQMLDMINTLLDISRLEDGRMPLDLSDQQLAPLIERAAERLTSLARERNIITQVDIAADLPKVLVDPELVVRVVQNLLANALKFSSRGSTVLIRAFETSPALLRAGGNDTAAVSVSVSDRGIGIAPKDQEKIFTKFGQVGERRGGTGLGLTFCKLVIEAHGGRIWVASTPGQGSTFFFTLPAAR